MNRSPRLTKNGHALFIDDVENRLAGILRSSLPRASLAADGRVQLDWADWQLLEGPLRPYAGLIPTLSLCLGGGALHSAPANGWLPAPYADPRIIDTTLGEFIRSRSRGLVRIGSAVRRAELLAEIAAAYPNSRIAFLGASRPRLNKVADRLRQCLDPRPVRTDMPEDLDDRYVVCSTFLGCGRGPYAHYDLVVLIDAAQATHQHAELALAQVDARFGLFGILQSDRRLSPSERERLFATFGPAVHDLPAHGKELAQVELEQISHTHGRIDCSRHTAVPWLRTAFWQSPARNRRLASLARGLRGGQSRVLEQHPDIREWLANHAGQAPRLTLLVANLEQAIALASDLPDWPIVCGSAPGNPPDLRGLSHTKRKLVRERMTMRSTGQQQLVTVAAAGWTSYCNLDVVIWAGGGPQRPPLPESWLWRPVGSGSRLLLVDIADRRQKLLRRWSAARFSQCIDAEWFPWRINPEVGRVLTFLSMYEGRLRAYQELADER